ncbi:MAG: TraA family conjugative transfer protein [Sideroxyarcus sp.]|nr:TraA family conjugative transfer protein [Sideroxyarcus sp.]
MNTKKLHQQKLQLLLAVAMLAPISAFAGTTGAEFLALYTWVLGIATGYAARAIAIAAIVVGALMSLGRGSPMPILSGIGFAVFLAYLPGVVNGLLTATI